MLLFHPGRIQGIRPGLVRSKVSFLFRSVHVLVVVKVALPCTLLDAEVLLAVPASCHIVRSALSVAHVGVGITFDDQGLLKVETVDPNKQKIVYELSNRKFIRTIPSVEFVFLMPNGVTVDDKR